MRALVFATTMEADPFDSALTEVAEKRWLSEDIWRYDYRDEGVLAAVVGMGMDASAAGMLHLLGAYHPSSVLNIGIAGALSDRVTIGGIYGVSRTVCWSGDSPEGYRLAPTPFFSLPNRTLVTSVTPVFDAALRDEMARTGDMVDMEGAAIAEVCAHAAVPCAAIKGISDGAKDGDRETLRKNLTAVSERLAAVIVPRLFNR